MNHLLGITDHFFAAVQSTKQVVNVVDAQSTSFQQCQYGGALTGGSFVERQYTVSSVCVERTEDTDTAVTFVTVEPHWFIVVRFTFDLLLHLRVEYRVIARYLPHKYIVYK